MSVQTGNRVIYVRDPVEIADESTEAKESEDRLATAEAALAAVKEATRNAAPVAAAEAVGAAEAQVERARQALVVPRGPELEAMVTHLNEDGSVNLMLLGIPGTVVRNDVISDIEQAKLRGAGKPTDGACFRLPAA